MSGQALCRSLLNKDDKNKYLNVCFICDWYYTKTVVTSSLNPDGLGTCTSYYMLEKIEAEK